MSDSTALVLPGYEHIYSGKVRDLYAPLDPVTGERRTDQVLLVASDRISAFDYVLDTPIPDKGRVLTQLSLWWFDRLVGLENHVVSTDVPAAVAGRAVLVRRLVNDYGASWIDAANVNAFTEGDGARVLFFCGDPIRFPEGLDVAVVLPELRAALSGGFAIGAVRAECEDDVARRFGVQRWPSLVFFRDGSYTTTLAGMYDWNDYLTRVDQALRMPPSRKPGIGIPVVTLGGDSHCH